MSLITRMMNQCNAMFGLNNANFSSMQNCQNATSKMNSLDFSGGDNFELSQATNKFNAQVYDAMLQSSKPKDKDFESFAYFT